MTNMEPYIPSPEKLASSSDKYLFFVALIGLITFAWFVMKRLMQMHEIAREETKRAQEEANKVRDKWEGSSEKFNLAIERNTQAFEKAHITMQECKVTTERAREVLQKFQ